ncbi:MAG: hypothetical protein WC788_00730 [Candidatus Paceibacterota bacterium]
MYELSLEIEPGELEKGIEDTLLTVEEIRGSGSEVIYFDLLKILGGKMGNNVAAIILRTEQRGLIGRGEIREVKNGRARPIIITEEGKKRLKEIKKTKKIERKNI